ncbi:MAG: hypothetical protein SGARI_005479, partial [Bacillariaceae sp.]
EIDHEYNLCDPNVEAKLENWIDNLTDVWVISHGLGTETKGALNNNYKPLFENAARISDGRLKGRKFGVVGIFWPSMPQEQYAKMAAQHRRWFPRRNTKKSALATLQTMQDMFPEERESLDRAKDALEAFSRNGGGQTEFEAKYVLPAKKEFLDSMAAVAGQDQVDVHNGKQSLSAVLGDQAFAKDLEEKGMLVLPVFALIQKVMVRGATNGMDVVAPLLRKLPSDKRVHLVGHSFGGLLWRP